jgi:hypothetical protein
MVVAKIVIHKFCDKRNYVNKIEFLSHVISYINYEKHNSHTIRQLFTLEEKIVHERKVVTYSLYSYV